MKTYVELRPAQGAAKSVLVFGVYMLGQGTVLLGAPNLLLEPLGLGRTVEFWPRAVGISLLVLGFYYVLAARQGLVAFFRLTVLGRTFQLIAFIGCVLAGVVTWRILPTALLEALAGGWTFWALWREGAWRQGA
ncbi:MAG: hypothetical protein SFW67_05015 [Myxococcaceae bacterium]|nr:hypothetical protein [Myxococcaceae bacterium]